MRTGSGAGCPGCNGRCCPQAFVSCPWPLTDCRPASRPPGRRRGAGGRAGVPGEGSCAGSSEGTAELCPVPRAFRLPRRGQAQGGSRKTNCTGGKPGHPGGRGSREPACPGGGSESRASRLSRARPQNMLGPGTREGRGPLPAREAQGRGADDGPIRAQSALSRGAPGRPARAPALRPWWSRPASASPTFPICDPGVLRSPRSL